RNAGRIHPEWELHAGDPLSLHPTMPPLRVSVVERGHFFIAYGAPDPQALATGKPWASASWLFPIEPLGDTSCRVISRFRSTCCDDLATRLSFGPTFAEPIGFAMDRRMLMGLKTRSERPMAIGARRF